MSYLGKRKYSSGGYARSVIKRRRTNARFVRVRGYRYGGPGMRPTYSRRQIINLANLRTAGYIGLENKFYDTGINTPVTVPTAWTTAATILTTDVGVGAAAANSPAQGDGASNRDGRQINVSSIMMNAQVSIAAATAQASPQGGTTIRMGYVLDTQSNGTAVATKSMVDVYSTQGQDTMGFRNLENEKRFRILAVKEFNLTPQNVADSGGGGATQYSWAGVAKKVTLFCKFPGKGLITNFNTTGTAGAMDTITDNAIYPFIISSNSAATVTCFFNQRCRFRG